MNWKISVVLEIEFSFEKFNIGCHERMSKWIYSKYYILPYIILKTTKNHTTRKEVDPILSALCTSKLRLENVHYREQMNHSIVMKKKKDDRKMALNSARVVIILLSSWIQPHYTKIPVLVWSPKLTNVMSGQYLGGNTMCFWWKRGNCKAQFECRLYSYTRI